jgi:hypothetical protein
LDSLIDRIEAATPTGTIPLVWLVDGLVFSIAAEAPNCVGCECAMPVGFQKYKVSINIHPGKEIFLAVCT